MAVGDGRRLPFFCVTKDARQRIRDHFDGRRISTALSVYDAFVEAENDERANGEAFSKPRKEIARLAGVNVRVIDEYADTFEELGLLRIERVVYEGRKLPNGWVLTDPPTRAGSDPDAGDGGKSGSEPQNPQGGGDSGASDASGDQGGSDPESHLSQEGEDQEGGGGERASARGLQLVPDEKPNPSKLPAGFPDHLKPVLTEVMDVLKEIAEAKNAKPPAKAAVASAMMTRNVDHAMLANDYRSWAFFGRGATRQVTDVAAQYRNWLDNYLKRNPEGAQPATGRTDMESLDRALES